MKAIISGVIAFSIILTALSLAAAGKPGKPVILSDTAKIIKMKHPQKPAKKPHVPKDQLRKPIAKDSAKA
jgi:hypothetical protein